MKMKIKKLARKRKVTKKYTCPLDEELQQTGTCKLILVRFGIWFLSLNGYQIGS